MGVSEDGRTLTAYVVLWNPSGREWRVVDDVDAPSARDAIKEAADDAGTYVAVPARSWKPMRVEQVQTVQTVITAADEPDQAKASNSKNAPESEIRAVEAAAEDD